MRVTDMVFKEKNLVQELRELLSELKEERNSLTDLELDLDIVLDFDILYASITYRLESILEEFE